VAARPRSWSGARGGGERAMGAVTVLVACMLPVFLCLAGLAVDVGHVFVARTELASVADAAARAGATQLDTRSGSVLRSGDGSGSELDPRSAEATAAAYATYHGTKPLNVRATTGQVEVRVGRWVPTVFLRIVHRDQLWIEARAVAHGRRGQPP
jgi:uncharacterized membrane protein